MVASPGLDEMWGFTRKKKHQEEDKTKQGNDRKEKRKIENKSPR